MAAPATPDPAYAAPAGELTRAMTAGFWYTHLVDAADGNVTALCGRATVAFYGRFRPAYFAGRHNVCPACLQAGDPRTDPRTAR